MSDSELKALEKLSGKNNPSLRIFSSIRKLRASIRNTVLKIVGSRKISSSQWLEWGRIVVESE